MINVKYYPVTKCNKYTFNFFFFLIFRNISYQIIIYITNNIDFYENYNSFTYSILFDSPDLVNIA